MQVKDKKSGDVETLRYSAAIDAVTAGTHEFVNTADTDNPSEASSETAPGGEVSEKMTKEELLAIAAERGVEIDPAKTKAEIVAAINAAG